VHWDADPWCCLLIIICDPQDPYFVYQWDDDGDGGCLSKEFRVP